jgi:YD repeat-containing protein
MVLNITTAERQQLAALYQSGQSLWRVPLTHFTPWDCNWPFGPPDDARAPNQPRPTWSPTPERECQRRGSIIACQSQTLGEAVEVPGTPYHLSYSSNRVPGHTANRTVRIPLSVGASLPASLRRIDVQIFIAGRRIDRTFAPTPDQVYTFVWDGKDANGQTVQTTQAAIIRVGYTYGAVYLSPDRFNRAFGAFGGEVTRVRARQEVTLWQQDEVMLSNPDARRVGLGGWNLSRHHVYDPVSGVLYLGNGRQRNVNAQGSLITTYAGNGSSVPTGDGVPATSVAVIWPVATDIDANGSLYVVATGSPYQRIRRIDASGIITTVAGAGVGGQDKDGIPATQAVLVGVADIALGPDGSLYLAQYSGTNRVRRIDANGLITTVAGTGYTTYNGDGRPATSANLHDPSAIALGADGNLYIAETFGYRIRAVGPDGLIRTVAGTGVKGLTGDGGPATQAQIGEVRGLDVAPDGSLYFTDSAYNVVRRIGPDGIISTLPIAGANAPWGLDVDANGQVYFTEYSSPRVRRIGVDGAVVMLAGTGTYGYSGDGLQATRAQFNQPYGVLAAPDGTVYVADYGNHRVRRIGAQSLSGLNPDELLIAAEDGREVYVFDLTGRHRRTLDGLTGALIEQFAYDSAGRLISVTDAFSNTTIIQHAANGQPIGLVAPGGQHTLLATAANGYLSSITYPTGEAITLTSSSHGLLTSLTTPRGGTFHFAYDAAGRLTRDENAAGGVTTLERTTTPDGYHVSVTSPLSRTTVYAVATLSTTINYRARIDPNGARTAVTTRPNGSQTTVYPDGTQIDIVQRPDPRWGSAATYPEAITLTLPGGLTTTQTISRSVTLATPGNPLSVAQIVDRVQQGSATSIYTYTASNRTVTNTSATGQSSIAQLDEYGRIISVTLAPGQTPITYTYNSLGQLIETRQGSQAWMYAYDAAQQLIGRRTAAGEDQRYGYDLTGRMISTTLPNDRALHFGYDDNGQLDQIVMPGGAIHTLTYNALNQPVGYTAPGNPALTTIFNADRSLASVTLPGGRTLTRTYDDSGRVTGMAYPEASTTFGYHVNNLMDRVNTLTRTPTTGMAQVIAYTYQGELPTSLTWSGAAQGAFSYTYNSRLFLTNLRLLSGLDTISTTLTYDADGQAITYGPFTLTRGGPARAISQLRDGTLTATLTYDSVARPISWTQQVNAQRPYRAQYTYDREQQWQRRHAHLHLQRRRQSGASHAQWRYRRTLRLRSQRQSHLAPAQRRTDRVCDLRPTRSLASAGQCGLSL